MYNYFIATLIITMFIIFSALITIYHDDILEKFNKNIFLITYIILLIICFFEFLIAHLQNYNATNHFIITFSKSFSAFAGPSLLLILAWGINDKKSKLLNYLVISIIAINFIIGFSGLFTDAIFYFDEQNNYHRGKFYFIHFVMVVVSILTLLVNTFIVGLKYQTRKNYILILDFILFFGALFIHIKFNGIWVLWISVSIAITILYIYYTALINQIDVLTGLLNRKCFDSQLYDLNFDAIILIIDINKFKEINDSLGHTVGDYCLVEIANAIKKVYSKSGYCYRIGGDEFSIILHKNLDTLDELNDKFRKKISRKKYKIELPTISIGHSYYYPNKSSVQKVIEEADKMMYEIKLQNS